MAPAPISPQAVARTALVRWHPCSLPNHASRSFQASGPLSQITQRDPDHPLRSPHLPPTPHITHLTTISQATVDKLLLISPHQHVRMNNPPTHILEQYFRLAYPLSSIQHTRCTPVQIHTIQTPTYLLPLEIPYTRKHKNQTIVHQCLFNGKETSYNRRWI